MTTDSHALKALGLFTVGAKLQCSTEIVCLAAYTWHRFFASSSTNLAIYDDTTYSAVCLLLASQHFEEPIAIRDLVNVFVATIHSPKNTILNDSECAKLSQSIIGATEVMLRVIDYKIGYHQVLGPEVRPPSITRPTSSSSFSLGSFRSSAAAASSGLTTSSHSGSSGSSVQRPIVSDTIKTTVSPHRYLVHYLDSLCDLMNDKDKADKLCNISWTYLSDFFCSPKVIQYKQEHLACASIEMALKTLKIGLPCDGPTYSDKKWFNVFCPDLSEQRLEDIVFVMVCEYERMMTLLDLETSPCFAMEA